MALPAMTSSFHRTNSLRSLCTSGPEEAVVAPVPRVPLCKRPISYSQSADTLLAPPTFEDMLVRILRKHRADLEEAFYQFQTSLPMKTVSPFDNEQKHARGEVVHVKESKCTSPRMSNSTSDEVIISTSFESSRITLVSPRNTLDTSSVQKRDSGMTSVSRRKTFVPKWHSTRRSRLEMFKHRVWNFLEQPDAALPNQLFRILSNFVIAISVASPVMATAEISEQANFGLHIVDIMFTLLFTLELLIKIVCYPDRLAFLKSMYTVIDFAVVIIGFLGIAFDNVESIWLDLIRTQVPILRLLKITRHSSGWRLLLMSMKSCASPLLVPLYLMLLMVVFTGSLHFWIDNVLACQSDCPESMKPAFKSIPHAMWFVVVSLSTVGYGDVVPHTDLGKLLASFQIVVGLCYMAMPLAIVGHSFTDVWRDRHTLLLRDKLSHGIIKRDLKDVKELFLNFDRDESGAITINEFLPFVESLEIGLSRRVIYDIFRCIDMDGSGIISFIEFADFVFPDSRIGEAEE